jgi:hypothetical protein
VLVADLIRDHLEVLAGEERLRGRDVGTELGERNGEPSIGFDAIE